MHLVISLDFNIWLLWVVETYLSVLLVIWVCLRLCLSLLEFLWVFETCLSCCLSLVCFAVKHVHAPTKRLMWVLFQLIVWVVESCLGFCLNIVWAFIWVLNKMAWVSFDLIVWVFGTCLIYLLGICWLFWLQYCLSCCLRWVWQTVCFVLSLVYVFLLCVRYSLGFHGANTVVWHGFGWLGPHIFYAYLIQNEHLTYFLWTMSRTLKHYWFELSSVGLWMSDH